LPPDTPEEELDLTPAQRRRIDEIFARLDELDDHTVLGIAGDASRAAVRRAYFERVAEFHTDRFFRKKLGSYKAKLEAISQRVTSAYEALGLHDRHTPDEPRRAPLSPVPPAPADLAREKALAALKQQLAARHAEARRLLEESKKATAHGDLAGAAEACRKAAALAPGDRAIQDAFAAARLAADAAAAVALSRQAEFEERFGHWAEAARTWQRVVEARPDDARARERLANARAHAGDGRSGA
jgi:tetratricopeptide (TPR) repeat protein